MKKPHNIEKDFKQNQIAFEQQPKQVKELQILKDESEKTTGAVKVAVQKRIQEKSKPSVQSQSDLP